MTEVCLLSGIPSDIDDGFYDEAASEDTAHDVLQTARQHYPDLIPSETDPTYATWLTRLAEAIDHAPAANEDDESFDFFQDPVLIIGHFSEEFGGDVPSRYVLDPGTGQYKKRILNGKGVQMKEVVFMSMGWRIDEYVRGPRGLWADATTRIATSCRARLRRFLGAEAKNLEEGNFGNFWIGQSCFEYLQAWIQLPETTNNLHDPPLSFVEEFYEVVNSRQRGISQIGSFDELDYQGVDRMLNQHDWKLRHGFEKGTRLVSQLCDDSAGAYQLLDALLSDCGYWIVISPEEWPRFQSRNNPTTPDDPKMLKLSVRDDVQQPNNAPLTKLPVELIELIATRVNTLADFFAFARTSTSLYNILTDTTRLKGVYKEMASSPSGCLFWLRPIPGRLDAAIRHLSGWIPKEERTWEEDPFDNPALHWIPLVRECYLYDHMRNRRRIWKQVKQIEYIWRDYRVNGWQVNRFITLDQADKAPCDH